MECCERVRMEAKFVRLDELQAFAGNAKSHDLGSIHLSVAQWGFLERIVVNEGTGHILSGHGRTDVLRQMRAAGQAPPEGIMIEDGDWLVPVDYVSVPENQEGAVTIALNRTVELGGWDNVKLAELLQEIANDGTVEIEATGYDAEGLDDLLRMLAPPELDDLADLYGDSSDSDFWPTITLKVSPDTFQAYTRIVAAYPGSDEVEKFSAWVEDVVSRHELS